MTAPLAHAADEFVRPSAVIQDLLDVPAHGEEPLNLVERYIAERSRHVAADELKPLVRQIADAALRGMAPDLLERRYASKVDVSSRLWFSYHPGANPRDQWCRDELLRQMREMAALKQGEAPADAERWARAIMVLVAQDRLDFGAGGGFGNIGAKPVVEVARLPLDERRRLDAYLRSLQVQRNNAIPHYGETSNILRRLIESPRDGGLWATEVPAFIDHLRSGWPKCPDVLLARYYFATNSWRLVCLARHEGREAFVLEQLKPAIEELKRETHDPIARRWLDQIAILQGGRPREAGVRVVTDPNQLKPGRPN